MNARHRQVGMAMESGGSEVYRGKRLADARWWQGKGMTEVKYTYGRCLPTVGRGIGSDSGGGHTEGRHEVGYRHVESGTERCGP